MSGSRAVTTKMLLGYARVSTREQDTALQREALRAAGVSVYFEDQISGIKKRPELDFVLSFAERGDTVLVYKLDRLGRSLLDLLRIAQQLEAKGVALRSITESLDTGSPAGKAMFQLLGVFAEFERSLIRERCMAGMQAAKARGVKLGRRSIVDDPTVWGLRVGGMHPHAIAVRLGVSHSSVTKAIFRMRKAQATICEGAA